MVETLFFCDDIREMESFLDMTSWDFLVWEGARWGIAGEDIASEILVEVEWLCLLEDMLCRVEVLCLVEVLCRRELLCFTGVDAFSFSSATAAAKYPDRWFGFTVLGDSSMDEVSGEVGGVDDAVL